MFRRYWSIYLVAGSLLAYLLYRFYVVFITEPRFYFDWIGNGYGVNAGTGNNAMESDNFAGFHIIDTSQGKVKKELKQLKVGDKMGVFTPAGERVATGLIYEEQPSAEGKNDGYPTILTINTPPPEQSVLDSSEPGKKNGYLKKIGYEEP